MSRRRWSIVVLLLAVLAVSDGVARGGAQAMAQPSVPNGPGGRAAAVARIVHGIFSYSRWPVQPAPVRLCVTGAPRHADQLGSPGRVAVTRLAPAAVAATVCDAAYLGHMNGGERSALLARLRGHPVLTIDEADPTCRGGAMFCLDVGMAQVGIGLNLDAVSRGGVRVDPRVLRLARPAGDGS